jgi:3-hydroxyisobutyrate dehydrogenase-like beta-hydroxyacid dehydrogenase
MKSGRTYTDYLNDILDAIKKAESFLRPVSEKRFYFGPLGQGHVAKIINNFICIGNLAVFSEALVLGAASGLDPQTLYDTLLTGTAQSRMLEIYGKQILKNDFQPRFKLALAHKDIGLARDLNRSIKGKVIKNGVRSLPVLNGIQMLFAIAQKGKLSSENISALIKPIENAYKAKFRVSP